METPNFNTQTVGQRHDDLITGVRTKNFVLSISKPELYENLDNVVYSQAKHSRMMIPQVRVVIPNGAKAYSNPVVIGGKLAFSYF